MVKKKDSVSSEHMEDVERKTFKKDEKPYLVFPCSKCKQYSYVKLTQKGKKCLRCGRTHQVSKIKDSGDIVNGMSVAVEMVKKRQNELAIERLGGEPNLLSTQSFKKVRKPTFSTHEEGFKISNSYEEFKHLLIKKTKRFSEFPKYIIDIVAEEIGISRSAKKSIIKQLLDEEKLLFLKNGLYKAN